MLANLSLGLALLGTIPWYSQEHTLLKVNLDHYDRSIIYYKLQEAFKEKYTIPGNNRAKLYLGDTKHEFACLKGTEIFYFLKTMKTTIKLYDASECRINLNPQYQVILNPTENIQQFIHRVDDPVMKSLELKLIEKFNQDCIPGMLNLKFYDFDNLDYNVECLIEYRDIAQIKLQELNLEVEFQQVVKVPDECGFKKFDLEFDGTYASNVVVDIPINGTFLCQQGRTSSCKKSTTLYSNARYKLFRNS